MQNVKKLDKFMLDACNSCNDNCGSESSTPETDVCVWCYTPLVVLATQEEEEEEDVLQITKKTSSYHQVH